MNVTAETTWDVEFRHDGAVDDSYAALGGQKPRGWSRLAAADWLGQAGEQAEAHWTNGSGTALTGRTSGALHLDGPGLERLAQYVDGTIDIQESGVGIGTWRLRLQDGKAQWHEGSTHFPTDAGASAARPGPAAAAEAAFARTRSVSAPGQAAATASAPGQALSQGQGAGQSIAAGSLPHPSRRVTAGPTGTPRPSSAAPAPRVVRRGPARR